MKQEHRAYLEGIVEGDDPSIRPADRIRAMELLEASEPEDAADRFGFDPEELARDIDTTNAALIYAAGVETFPETVKAVCSALGREHFERLRRELHPPLPPEPVPPTPAPTERAPKRAIPPEPISEPEEEDDAAETREEESRGPSWANDAWKLERGFSDS